MKKKPMRILFSLLFVAVLTTAFSMTAFAAGDVAGAIESTWNAAKGQIQTVVNNVVFPVLNSGRRTSTTESTGSSNSQLRAFCLPALFSR